MDLTRFERRIIETPYWATQRSKELQFLSQWVHGRVLNVWAGRAPLYTRHFSERVTEVVNIDREELFNGNVQGDATALPFPDEDFDAVTFLRVLHHIPDFSKALSEAYRVLRRGWQLLLSEPPKHFSKLWKITWLCSSHPDISVGFDDIRRFAREHNMTVRDFKRIFWFYYWFCLRKN